MAKSKLKKIKKTPQFPHNYRSLNAKPAIFALLAAFLALNLFPPLPWDFVRLEQAKEIVMTNPYNLSSHLLLSQEYLGLNDMKNVQRELALAEYIYQNQIPNSKPQVSSVLGASVSPQKVWEQIKNEPVKIGQEISYWENIVGEKKDYRDGYLQLANLYLELGNTNKARSNLQKALEIDPNFEVTKELQELIK